MKQNPEHVASVKAMLLVIFYTGILNLVDPHVLQAEEVTTDIDKYELAHHFCTGFP